MGATGSSAPERVRSAFRLGGASNPVPRLLRLRAAPGASPSSVEPVDPVQAAYEMQVATMMLMARSDEAIR